MPRFPVAPNAKPSLWQTLLAPMLLVSLGLHGLLLLIPVASSDEAVIPPPDPEQDNVAITRVPPAATHTAPLTRSVPMATAPVQSRQPQPQTPAVIPQETAPTRSAISNQSSPGATVAQADSNPPSPSPSRSVSPNLTEQEASQHALAPSRGNSPPPGLPAPDLAIPPLGQDRREQILAYASSLDFSQERMDQLAAVIWQRYGYSLMDTTRGEYTDNLSQWQEQIQQATGLADLTAEEDRTTFEVSFERRVCLVTPPGDIKVGFVVNPDGSLQGSPVLLRSSGYTELNQKALETVQGYEAPGADQLKAYTVTVETSVDYGENDCLSPPQQPSDTSTDT